MLKCNRFDFGWGSTPHPHGGAYIAPRPTTGPTSKGKEGRKDARATERRKRSEEKELLLSPGKRGGKEGTGKGGLTPKFKIKYRPWGG